MPKFFSCEMYANVGFRKREGKRGGRHQFIRHLNYVAKLFRFVSACKHVDALLFHLSWDLLPIQLDCAKPILISFDLLFSINLYLCLLSEMQFISVFTVGNDHIHHLRMN